MEPTKCSQCGNVTQCSYIHISNNSDGDNDYITYCDSCLHELFQRIHRQLILYDYMKSAESTMDKIAAGNIDVGKPN